MTVFNVEKMNQVIRLLQIELTTMHYIVNESGADDSNKRIQLALCCDKLMDSVDSMIYLLSEGAVDASVIREFIERHEAAINSVRLTAKPNENL